MSHSHTRTMTNVHTCITDGVWYVYSTGQRSSAVEMLSVAGWRTAWVLTDCVRSQADSCGDAVLVRQSEVG
jgi:hypothetical protein